MTYSESTADYQFSADRDRQDGLAVAVLLQNQGYPGGRQVPAPNQDTPTAGLAKLPELLPGAVAESQAQRIQRISRQDRPPSLAAGGQISRAAMQEDSGQNSLP